MKNCILLVFVIIYIWCSITEGTVIEDYCWRDFVGDIPSDALVAGRDRHGKRLYIGQVLYEDKIIAGKIREGENKIYFEYFSKEYSSTDNIKILCARNPGKFKWLPTKHTEILSLLPEKTLIKGGYEKNCDMYLGRLKKHDSVNVGKVMCCVNSCYGLYTTDNGTGTLDQAFEVLSYNESDDNRDNYSPDIDMRGDFISSVPKDIHSCKRISITVFQDG